MLAKVRRRTKLLITLLVAVATVISIVVSNAGVDDQPTERRRVYIPSPNLSDDDEDCYEQMSGDGYAEVICE